MRPFVIVAGLTSIAVIIALTVIWLLLPLTVDNRIELSQLIVELAGFSVAIFAAAYAAQQFIQSQRMPDLTLFLQSPAYKDGGLVTELVSELEDSPGVYGVTCPFFILLDNSHGNGAARYVCVDIEITGFLIVRQEPWESLEERHIKLDDDSPYKAYWTINYDYDDFVWRFRFNGGADFICYAHDRVTIGKFWVPAPKAWLPIQLALNYHIRAEGMRPKVGKRPIKAVLVPASLQPKIDQPLTSS